MSQRRTKAELQELITSRLEKLKHEQLQEMLERMTMYSSAFSKSSSSSRDKSKSNSRSSNSSRGKSNSRSSSSINREKVLGIMANRLEAQGVVPEDYEDVKAITKLALLQKNKAIQESQVLQQQQEKVKKSLTLVDSFMIHEGYNREGESIIFLNDYTILRFNTAESDTSSMYVYRIVDGKLVWESHAYIDSGEDEVGLKEPIHQISISPDGKALAISTENGIQFGKVDLGVIDAINIFTNDIPYMMAFSPDGSLFAYVVPNKKSKTKGILIYVYGWNKEEGVIGSLQMKIPCEYDGIEAFKFIENNYIVINAWRRGKYTEATIISLKEDGRIKKTIENVYDIAVSKNILALATGSHSEKQVSLYDTRQLEKTNELKMISSLKGSYSVGTLAISPNGKHVILLQKDPSPHLSLWSVSTGNLMKSVKTGEAYSVVFHPKGTMISYIDVVPDRNYEEDMNSFLRLMWV